MGRYPGKFITLEGGEGSGKTSLVPHLTEFLRERGYKVYPMREPGGTVIGEQIRQVIKSYGDAKMNTVARALLFQSARAQIVDEVVLPRLSQGEIVVSDRFSDSTIAYQGYGDGIDLALLTSLTRIVTQGLIPDITVLLDVEPSVGLSRRMTAGGVDGFDSLPIDYHERVNRAYRMLANESERWITIDANRVFEEVKADLFRLIVGRLELWSGQEGTSRRIER